MPVFAFIGGVGPWELAIILVIVLILFGAGRLPQVFESFGKGMKAFKDAQKDDKDDVIDVSPKKAHKELADHVEEDEIEEAEPVEVKPKKRSTNG